MQQWIFRTKKQTKLYIFTILFYEFKNNIESYFNIK